MPAARKTLPIAELVNRANRMNDADIEDYFNRWGDNVTPGQAWRMGISAFIESVLHDTDNYNGYQNTSTDDSKRHYSTPK